MRAARNDILVYLDGDLQGLRDDLIESLAGPILDGEADFVKARFSRNAGRVTSLTARPLLRTYFPELARFGQPLGGIAAARRSLLEKLRFENDYGVDIGLFIDAAMSGARLAEVDIGHIEHDSHPLEVLEEMATQVARTLLDRAGACGRLRPSYIRESQEVERHKRMSISAGLQRVPTADRVALFDMDGVLLDGRFIVELAARTGRAAELARFLDNYSISAADRSRKIAALFAGVPLAVFEQAAREMPLVRGAVETVIGLRKAGFRVGIVTDSFHVASETVRRRVFADFSLAHLMRFRHGKATGRLTLCPAMFHEDGCAQHDHCKVNVLRHLTARLGIGFDRVLAVGDGENDVCLLHAAGWSVAFQPKSERVRAAAQHVVHGDLSGVLAVLRRSESESEPALLE